MRRKVKLMKLSKNGKTIENRNRELKTNKGKLKEQEKENNYKRNRKERKPNKGTDKK